MSAESKCTNCGTVNPAGRSDCRVCGHPLHLTEAAVLQCPACKSMATPIGEERCVSCGWKFEARPRIPQAQEKSAEPAECEAPAEAELHTVRSFALDLAAIFMMVSGALGIFHALMAALPTTGDEILSAYESVIPAGRFLDEAMQQNLFLSVLMFAFGILAIALSMTAIRKSSYAGSIAGSVLGIMSIGFLLGAFFGLMALILLIISRREFLLECS